MPALRAGFSLLTGCHGGLPEITSRDYMNANISRYICTNTKEQVNQSISRKTKKYCGYQKIIHENEKKCKQKKNQLSLVFSTSLFLPNLRAFVFFYYTFVESIYQDFVSCSFGCTESLLFSYT